jgi:uncharacterized protein
MRVAALKTQDGRLIVRRARFARSFRERLIGLLSARCLSADEGLLLSPGGSIHTFGMRYPIDVLFLDRQLRILRVLRSLRPWRLCLAPAQTKHVLELRAGTLEILKLKPHTFICIDPEPEVPKDTGSNVTAKCAPVLSFSLRIPNNDGRESKHP